MRAATLALVLVTAAAAQAFAADARIAFVRNTPAREFDAELPVMPLAQWLKRELPTGTSVKWSMTVCGTRVGEPAGEPDVADLMCVAALIKAPGRARDFELHFEPTARVMGLVFVDTPDGRLFETPRSVSDVPGAFDTPISLDAIDCAAGTEPFLLEQNGVTFEGCQKGQAIDGFYRSWFRYGVQLMERGTFSNGVRVGRWTSCDAEGRCKAVAY